MQFVLQGLKRQGSNETYAALDRPAPGKAVRNTNLVIFLKHYVIHISILFFRHIQLCES